MMITSDNEFFKKIDLEETKRYFIESYKFVCNYKNLGERNIISAAVHLDETIPSMRIDNIVSELARCSRGKANELLAAERVLVNYEVIQKSSKEIKPKDIVTIRGKGRFEIKEIKGNTRSGRILLEVGKFC